MAAGIAAHCRAAVDTAALDAIMRDYSTTVPAVSVAVVKNGEVVYAKAFGRADIETGTANTTETNFRLASFTKQFTAMAVMILIDRKQLSLDTTLNELFAEFPAYGERITVQHLLNHTSGLLDYEDLMPTTTSMPLLDRDVLWLLAQQDHTSFPPGTKYSYSNSGYALLAVIVEKVSGATFASFMKQNIFDPLGMSRTVVNERGITRMENRAYGHSTTTSTAFEKTDQSLTSYVCGDGGIYSNLPDLLRWERSLYTADLVSSGMLQQAFTPGPATIDEKGAGYGFGWNISQYRGKRCLAHSGGTRGFSTRIERYPDEQFAVIVLTNRSGAEPTTLTHRIVDICLFPE